MTTLTWIPNTRVRDKSTEECGDVVHTTEAGVVWVWFDHDSEPSPVFDPARFLEVA